MNRSKKCIFGCDFIDGYYRPMHRFPNHVKWPKLFAAWVAAAGDYLTETDPVRIHKNKRVCDKHFEHSQRQGRARLVWSAVPTVKLFPNKQTIKTIVETDHNYCVELYTRIPLKPSDFCSSSDVHSDFSTGKVKDTGAGDKCDNAESPNSEEMAYSPASDEETGMFSWQKENSVIDTDVAVKAELTESDTALDTDTRLYEDREPSSPTQDDVPDNTYRCNECEGNIIGFRYACVQCADFDLCGACEARGAHNAHYVLRVPPHRPYEEEQAMLAAIRLQLLHDQVFIQDEHDRTEVKEESEEESLCEDPLSADHEQEEHVEGKIRRDIEIEHHLPKKRPRLRFKSLSNKRQKITKIHSDEENPNDSDRLHDMEGMESSDNHIADITNRDTKSHHSHIGTPIDKRTNHITNEDNFSSDAHQSVTKNQPLDEQKIEEYSFGDKSRILIQIPRGANAKDLFRRISERETKRLNNRPTNKEVAGIIK